MVRIILTWNIDSKGGNVVYLDEVNCLTDIVEILDRRKRLGFINLCKSVRLEPIKD